MASASEVIEVPLTQGYVAIVDAADWDRECRVCFRDGLWWIGRPSILAWTAEDAGHAVYARAKHGERQIALHRLVMDAGRGQEVDHKDCNGLNCVRSNLRFVTPAQNCHNRRKLRRTTTRFKGAAFHAETGKYEAYIRHNRRKRHLGLFATEEDAARAYDAAALQLWGEFSRLNFPTSKEASCLS